MEFERHYELFVHGATEIISKDELKQKLKEDRPLNLKLGLDPSAPDIHLGHTVVLRKLKLLQDIGHKVKIIIGDFTGKIGDPTGRSQTRKSLSDEEILKNAETYKDQIFKILHKEKTELFFNSNWLASLKFEDVIKLSSLCTVARMLERDDFAKRYQNNYSISIHEFFYPIMQGYDSVVLKADVEFGATEQKFNLLMGRDLQREYGQQEQIAYMMPILIGLDGNQKMSKSLGNYIGIYESPKDIYGKAMSIPDELLIHYFTLVTDLLPEEIKEIKAQLENNKVHPRDLKMRLARELVTLYHDEEQALKAEENFKRVFQERELPDDMPEVELDEKELQNGKIWIVDLLKSCKLISSNSEGKRMIKQGAVKLNREKVTGDKVDITPEDGMIIQVGKRKYARLKIKNNA